MKFLRRFAARNRWVLVALAVVVAVALIGTVVLAVRHSPGGAAGSDRQRTAASGESTVATQSPGGAAASHQAASPSAVYIVTEPAPGTGVLGNDPREAPIAGGQTDHLRFAARVAAALMSYNSTTDFQTRNAALMQLALPEPYGDPPGLSSDLARYTPAGQSLATLRAGHERVTWRAADVQLDQWAESRIRSLGGPSGAHGVDVTGVQTITAPGRPTVTVPIQLSMTVVCPPATTACGLDRIFSGPLQQARQ